MAQPYLVVRFDFDCVPSFMTALGVDIQPNVRNVNRSVPVAVSARAGAEPRPPGDQASNKRPDIPAVRKSVCVQIPRDRAYGDVIVSCMSFVPEQPALSVTITVKLVTPATAGLPSNNPRLDNVNPAGSVPDCKDQAYGDAPPLAINV